MAAIVVMVLAPASPAFAHAGGLTPRDHRVEVTGITPPVTGLSARMVNNGTQLQLRNAGTADVTVLPDRAGDPSRVVRAGDTVRLTDPRTQPPPLADGRAAEGRWRIPVRTTEGTSAVVGQIEWRPGPSPLPWWLLIAGLAITGSLLGRVPWWRAGLAAGVVAVTGAHVAHVAGSALAVTGQPFVSLFLGASGVGLVCWPLGAATVVAAARRSTHTAFVAAVVGAALVVAALPDFGSFGYSELPFAWPASTDRLLLASTLGGGAGLAAGGFVGMRRQLSGSEPLPGATEST